MADSTDDLMTGKRLMARIGLDDLAARRAPVSGDPSATASYPVVDFATLRASGSPHVLDVRRGDEWEAGHIRNAMHVPLHELIDRMGELPQTTMWVHCASGFRAAIAASLLDRAGHEVVLIDDEFDRGGQAGLDLTTPEPSGRTA